VFVFPGDPHNAAETALPELPEFNSVRHKTIIPTSGGVDGINIKLIIRNPIDLSLTIRLKTFHGLRQPHSAGG